MLYTETFEKFARIQTSWAQKLQVCTKEVCLRRLLSDYFYNVESFREYHYKKSNANVILTLKLKSLNMKYKKGRKKLILLAVSKTRIFKLLFLCSTFWNRQMLKEMDFVRWAELTRPPRSPTFPSTFWSYKTLSGLSVQGSLDSFKK